jgi:pilus assembly protein TadC
MAIRFERLISRNVAVALSNELDMAGMRTSVERVARLAVLGFIAIFVIFSFMLYLFVPLSQSHAINSLLDVLVALGLASLYIAMIYAYMEYRIDYRKTKMEAMIPDYLQIASANLRSGISLDRAMLLAARPEFEFLSEDIKDMNMRIFEGENFNDALAGLAKKYRSYQLSHAVRMITESIIYGGAMADLLEQLSKDIRSQQLTQKEVAGQLFLYSIFIAFAGVIASPVLYGITSQMIAVTSNVWTGILAANPGGLPTTGLSFLKPSPPKITPTEYHYFAIASIVTVSAFASLILAAISTGNPIKGLKYMPVFIATGLGIFFISQLLLKGVFAGIGAA